MFFVSLIVPAFNEEGRLPETLSKLASFLNSQSRFQSEVLVVNDGSTDGTARVISQMAERDARFRLVSYGQNRGKGFAVKRGMLEARGEWRLITDADLSTPIEEFWKLHQAAEREAAAIAIGSRALNRKLIDKHQSWFRETGGRVFNLLMRLATGLSFSDTQCGFKLYRFDAAEAIFRRQVLDGFSFDVEDLFIAHKLGLEAIEVPVRWTDAEGTKVTTAATIRAITDLWEIRRNSWRGEYDGQLNESAVRLPR